MAEPSSRLAASTLFIMGGIHLEGKNAAQLNMLLIELKKKTALKWCTNRFNRPTVFINNKKWLKSTHTVLHSSRSTDTCVEKHSGERRTSDSSSFVK